MIHDACRCGFCLHGRGLKPGTMRVILVIVGLIFRIAPRIRGVGDQHTKLAPHDLRGKTNERHGQQSPYRPHSNYVDVRRRNCGFHCGLRRLGGTGNGSSPAILQAAPGCRSVPQDTGRSVIGHWPAAAGAEASWNRRSVRLFVGPFETRLTFFRGTVFAKDNHATIAYAHATKIGARAKSCVIPAIGLPVARASA